MKPLKVTMSHLLPGAGLTSEADKVKCQWKSHNHQLHWSCYTSTYSSLYDESEPFICSGEQLPTWSGSPVPFGDIWETLTLKLLPWDPGARVGESRVSTEGHSRSLFVRASGRDHYLASISIGHICTTWKSSSFKLSEDSKGTLSSIHDIFSQSLSIQQKKKNTNKHKNKPQKRRGKKKHTQTTTKKNQKKKQKKKIPLYIHTFKNCIAGGKWIEK